MLAFHNQEELKKKTIKAMKADIKAERLVSGHYWNDSKTGCFVGCVIRGSNHSKFETELGIPRIIARLGDCLFEGLSKYAGKEAARSFSVDFLEAISPGADLSLVWPKFAIFMLIDKDSGVLQYARSDKTKKAIQDVADLYQRIINGEKILDKQWKSVRKLAAAAAAAAAAEAEAYAAFAAADAAYAFAAAAAAAAAYAFAAAAAAAAAADARSRRYTALATCLLTLFREARAKLAA